MSWSKTSFPNTNYSSSFILQISVILTNLILKNYIKISLKIIRRNVLEIGALTHELYFILNGTILLYTIVLPHIELVEHV